MTNAGDAARRPCSTFDCGWMVLLMGPRGVRGCASLRGSKRARRVAEVVYWFAGERETASGGSCVPRPFSQPAHQQTSKPLDPHHPPSISLNSAAALGSPLWPSQKIAFCLTCGSLFDRATA